MKFIIESSKTPIYNRIAIAFHNALQELGHTVYFYDPSELDSYSFTQIINSIDIDYYFSTNVFNKIHDFNIATQKFNFEEIRHSMIFIHHDSAFSAPNSIHEINKKLNALIYHQEKINHFFIEENNIKQFQELGIKNCFPLKHASEFKAIQKNLDFSHQLSFVGHLMSGLKLYPINQEELGHHLIGLVWNRYSNSTFEIQPKIEELCSNSFILEKLNLPIAHKLSVHRYLMQLVTQFTMAYRGEVISNINNHHIDIYGGDLSYGQIESPLMKIDKSNIGYHPATSDYSETVGIYGNSKISINISSLQFDSAINNRIVDIILSGGFALTDRRSELVRSCKFSNDISFETPEELQHLLDYYLHKDNQKKYLEIKEYVFNEFKDEYTYINSCSNILNALSDSKISHQFSRS